MIDAEDRGGEYCGLHVLADDDPRWPKDPVEQAREACAGGAPIVQLRTKHATDRQALAWAEAIREITRAAGARSGPAPGTYGALLDGYGGREPGGRWRCDDSEDGDTRGGVPADGSGEGCLDQLSR